MLKNIKVFIYLRPLVCGIKNKSMLSIILLSLKNKISY